ncbi:MAG: 2-amino-4-hydroxy-6-hydroxymethyldihydropteridine diphosphokinase [Pseudomonadota bacterium]
MAHTGNGDHLDAIVALGSNVGDKRGNIARAIELLTEAGDIRLVARSRDYKTPPWGKTDQDWFVNACIGVATRLAPRALLERCLASERRMGRVRAERWGPRSIDLDVLHVAGVVLDEPDLVLPHPRITERAFVLAPLADIAPDLMLQGKTVAEWLATVDRTGVEPFAETVG